MSVKTVVVCDGCGREKGEANHWILFNIVEAAAVARSSYVAFHAWDETSARVLGHLCSEECAIKVLRRTLNLQNEEPTQ
jgi:predicted Fe-S protein YdhL (DUF1289 family)